MTTFDDLDDLDDLVGRDAVADEPAAPGEPGHAEELDELAEIGDSLRPEGEELDDRPGPGGLPPRDRAIPTTPSCPDATTSAPSADSRSSC